MKKFMTKSKNKKQDLPELEINRQGKITFPSLSVVFDPSELTPDICLEALADYKAKDDLNMGTSFIWQSYAVLFEGETAFLSFCFKEDLLIELSISVELSSQKTVDDWPTEASSKQEIKFIQKAFRKQFGGKLKYGKPYHYFDLKGFCAQCGISYHNI